LKACALRTKRFYAAWADVHFFLLTVVCFRGVFWLVAQNLTILPSALDKYGREGEAVTAYVLGTNMAPSVRLGIATYLHAAGSESGYGYFAPNITNYHKLILELYYDDGRVEYESPHVTSGAAALRLAALSDTLADPSHQPIREVVVKMLAYSTWREHPDVKKIRAILGSVDSPSVSEFEHGKRESFHPVFSYDFSLREEGHP